MTSPITTLQLSSLTTQTNRLNDLYSDLISLDIPNIHLDYYLPTNSKTTPFTTDITYLLLSINRDITLIYTLLQKPNIRPSYINTILNDINFSLYTLYLLNLTIN